MYKLGTFQEECTAPDTFFPSYAFIILTKNVLTGASRWDTSDMPLTVNFRSYSPRMKNADQFNAFMAAANVSNLCNITSHTRSV